jgi:Uncharacterized conserved protein (DUF2249)
MSHPQDDPMHEPGTAGPDGLPAPARDPWLSRIWTEPDGTHIDVRGLPPPQPLVQILRLVAHTPDGGPIIVHLDRDPALLYVELLQVGWWAESTDGDPGEVRLRLARQP